MLRKVRIIAATFFMIAITLLFLDFTGTARAYLGWCAKIQFVPALFAVSFAVFVGIILFTLLFGRIYCSVLCPLGIFQDIFSRRQFSYRPPRKELIVLRYAFLAVFLLFALIDAGLIVALLEPYSAYGRIVSQLLSPVYKWGNNLLAYFAERADSYAFYSVDVWLKSASVLVIAILTSAAIGISAWKSGRGYCNTICPVGAFFSLFARFFIMKMRIDKEKCGNCGLCAQKCKGACINAGRGEIDYLRCVACFNCMESCPNGAIKYTPAKSQGKLTSDGLVRRSLIVGAVLFATDATARQFDGGLIRLEKKKAPERSKSIVPLGADSSRNFHKRCTGCQLCISVCSNQVLRPGITKPYMSFERGYCRPECVNCSQACPSGAIRPITTAEKSSIQIGYAVWKRELCVADCNLCERKCTTGAIQRVDQGSGEKILVIDQNRCIGCGACEHLCPSRPYSAIYVEGVQTHRVV